MKSREAIILIEWIFIVFGGITFAQSDDPAPGGFLETYGGFGTRGRLSVNEIANFLPSRGEFIFPAPYGTRGVRITNAATDCGGQDCVNYIGYSYWRRINNHVGSDVMYILLVLDPSSGGTGPTLFSYHKVTGVVQNLGGLWLYDDGLYWHHGEGWYWSGTGPTTFYAADSTKLYRVDALTKAIEEVLDIRSANAAAAVGSNRRIWQLHSSDDDRVHSATIRDGSSNDLGCLAYKEASDEYLLFPVVLGNFDECQVDKSGRWLLIKEQVDGQEGEDNRIIDLDAQPQPLETILVDPDGAPGHSDNGYGYMVGADNWLEPGAQRLWMFGESTLQGRLVYRHDDWSSEAPAHISHLNALPGVPPERQYACGSTASRRDSPHANEVICFRLDTSLEVLVVAPVMTDLDAAGGGSDYSKMPKGNLDITGQYFVWTSNLGGGQLDAFLVRVPGQLLSGSVFADGFESGDVLRWSAATP